MLLRRPVLLVVLLTILPCGADLLRPTSLNAQERRGIAPVAIRIPDANVDAPVLTAKIVNGVPDDVGCPDVVLWYEETGRLGAPGNAVLVGAATWYNFPGAFAELDALEPDDLIEVTGEDGKIYRFLVETLTTYDRATAPLNEIFGESESEKQLTLLTDAGEADSNTRQSTDVLVVVAQRTKEKATRPATPATPTAEATPWLERDCIA